jgi:hypothetical protein
VSAIEKIMFVTDQLEGEKLINSKSSVLEDVKRLVQSVKLLDNV